MKAIVYQEYGTIDNFSLQEVLKPSPKDNEVLVKVHAACINDWDFGLLKGDLINRMINGLKNPKRQILGSDIAGVVEKTGRNVSSFKVGDKVYGDLTDRWGGFAEYVCAYENMLFKMPENISFEEAASIPQAALLALQGLINCGKLRKGQSVLVNGAGGGVGTFAVQIAKELGAAEVTGVDSSVKQKFMTDCGYDHVADYQKVDFTCDSKKYDLILDNKMLRPLKDYLKALKPGGTYVTAGGKYSLLLRALISGPFLSMISGKKIKILGFKPNKGLDKINQLYENGKIKPVIDGYFTLDHFMDAMKLYDSAEQKGKVVISMIK